MDGVERQLHLRAGKAYGRDATCGTKIDYRSEESALRGATAMAIKHGRQLEHYPCFWCSGWHIGRAMSEAERRQFAVPEEDGA